MRLRYECRDATELHGEKRHPQIVIKEFCRKHNVMLKYARGDAFHDAWFFETNVDVALDQLPPFIKVTTFDKAFDL